MTNFITNESGAVTVDWVVLTGAIIGLGVAVMASVGTGTTGLADTVESTLEGTGIASYLPASGTLTARQYVDAAGGFGQFDNADDRTAAFAAAEAAIAAKAPDGFVYAGFMDQDSEYPVYLNAADGLMSIGGETLNSADYAGTPVVLFSML
jgi:hypothetical protein